MNDQRGLLREGFNRAWRYRRVLWFIFFINLALSHFAAGPIIHKLDGVTDHSLYAAQRLVNTFDVGSFEALSSNPEVKLFEVAGASISSSIVFFVVVLFLTGGILEAYRSARRLTTREFFEACGSYFWRWVRLLILMGIVLIPVFMLGSFVSKETSTLMEDAMHEKSGYTFFVAGMGVVGLLVMFVRLWFDMAQVRAVVEEESGMWRNAGHALKITTDNLGSLFWMFLRISVVGALVFGAGLYIWTKMPPARFPWTVFSLEIVTLCGFGLRLWLRACEMIWYQRKFLAPAIAAPVAPSVPTPLVTIAPPPTPLT
jgi:hypothetical protein